MFGLFKKKDRSPQAQYKFFVSEVEKYRHFAKEMLSADQGNFVLLYHFENTASEMARLLEAAQVAFATDRNTHASVWVLDSEEFITSEIHGTPTVIVTEIYPLAERDQQIIQKAAEKSLPVAFYASLDSAFFKMFAGERLLSLMEKLGVAPGEVLEHRMISSSVQRAQKKVAQQIGIEQRNKESIEAWISQNQVDLSA